MYSCVTILLRQWTLECWPCLWRIVTNNFVATLFVYVYIKFLTRRQYFAIQFIMEAQFLILPCNKLATYVLSTLIFASFNFTMVTCSLFHRNNPVSVASYICILKRALIVHVSFGHERCIWLQHLSCISNYNLPISIPMYV